MSSALDNLVNCLLQCCSHDNKIRQPAENQLRSAGNISGFGNALIIVSLDQSRPEQARQLAAVYLKQFIKQFWSGDACRFTSQEKEFARTNLLTGLCDPLRLMRTAFGLCIAKIAQEDWPDAWPDLFDRLLAGINSGNTVHILGVVRCMSLFCDWLDDVTVPKLAPSLFPTLTRIISDDESFGPQTRKYAGMVVKTCVVLLSHMRGHPEMPAFNVLAEGAQQWLGPLLNTLTLNSWQRQQVWQQKVIQSGQTMAEDCNLVSGYGVQIESLQVMSVLVGELHKLLGNETRLVFMTIWRFTEQVIPLYINLVVNSSDENTDASIFDDEGNGVGIDVLLVQIFEFLNAVAEVPHNSVRALLSQGMSQIFQASVVVIQMTNNQLNDWTVGKTEQGNSDDDVGVFGVGDLRARNVAVALVRELMDSFTEEALAAGSSAFEWGVNMANDARKKSDSNWWRLLEASLLIAGILSRGIQDQTNSSLFNTGAVIEIAFKLIRAPQDIPPVLWSRCMWLLGRFSWALTPEQGCECFKIGVTALGANQPTPVRVASCCALIELQHHLKSHSNRSNLLFSSVQGTCSLLSSTSSESLPIIVGAVSEFINQAGPEIASAVEPHLTPALVQVWSQHASNPHLCESIVDVFQSLASNSSALSGLQSRLLPTLCSLVNDHEKKLPGIVEYALDLMKVIARSDEAGNELSSTFLGMSVPCVLQFMSTSNDNAGLCSGAACLSAIIYSAKTSLRNVSIPSLPNPNNTSNNNNTTSIDAILFVVSRLLSPGFPEMGSACVGTLVTQIITCLSDTLNSNIVKQLCHAMIMKLESCRFGDLKMNIILFFARLIHKDIHSIMSILMPMQIQCQDGQTESAFVTLMQSWTTEQQTFSGKFQVKATLLALPLIFQHYSGQCAQIMVNGDLVVDPNEGRMTRSKGKKKLEYQSISLPLKIVQILLRAVDVPEEEYETDDDGMGVMGGGSSSSSSSSSIGGGSVGGGGMSSGIFAPAEDFEEFMLSDIGSRLFWEDEDEDDAETIDILEDPLYPVDLQQDLLMFFKQRTSQEINNIATNLNHDDQQKLLVVRQMTSHLKQSK
jgi:importin-9